MKEPAVDARADHWRARARPADRGDAEALAALSIVGTVGLRRKPHPPALGPLGIEVLQRLAGNRAVALLLAGNTVVQRVKTPPERLAELEKRKVVTKKVSLVGVSGIKKKPKHPGKYTSHSYGGRSYYYRRDAQKRVVKISGPLVYTNAKRVATAKVKYKRKTDASGHLIAHSFGGPPKLTENYVAMNKAINSAGGDWGAVEGYIRTRLKQAGIAVWMAVYPEYAGVGQRPTKISVRLRFNKSPHVVWFSVDTP